jgi:ankyrin repeat protein
MAVDGIEPNVLDRKGRSAFRLAAELRYSEVMEELGKDPRTQLNLPCAKGRTAYDMIIRGGIGDGGVFRVLLSLDPVHVHANITSSEPSLLHRACSVLPKIRTRLLGQLKSEDADVDVDGLVKALLDLPTIDVNLRDRAGNTPLTLAIRSCQVGTVRALLQHKDILPNIEFEVHDSSDPTMETTTPLLMAASVFDILTKVLPPDIIHITFRHAVRDKYYRFQNKILNLLLDCPKVLTGHTNSKGWTALHVAAAHGDGEMIRSILDKTSLYSHISELLPSGQSILSLAMANRMVDDETVKLLFAHTPPQLHPDRERLAEVQQLRKIWKCVRWYSRR